MKRTNRDITAPQAFVRQPFVFRYFTVIIVILIGTISTFFFYGQAEQTYQHYLHKDFDRYSKDSALALQKEIRNNLEVLYSVRSFYIASQDVSREEFNQFIRDEFKYYPEIFAIEWVPRILDKDRVSVEQPLTLGGQQLDFRIVQEDVSGKYIPVPPKDEYFPVYYVEPVDANKGILGVDYSANPSKRDLMQKAVDSMDIVTTPIHKIARFDMQSMDSKGFLALIAIDDHVDLLDTIANRRMYLRGYVTAIFNLGQLIQIALKDQELTQKNIQIFAPTETAEQELVYTLTTSKLFNSRIAPKYEWRTNFDVGGQMWTFIAQSTPEFFSSQPSSNSPFILIAGFFLTAFVAAVLIAHERKKTRDFALALSLTDELTGLYNRRGFMLLFEQQRKMSIREKKGFVVILGDLDGLKKINDEFGHIEGDRALMHAGEILKNSLRQSDMAARLGGDEFSAICVGENLVSVEGHLERIQSKFQTYNENQKGSYTLDMSFGYAFFDPAKPEEIPNLIKQADKILYQNKTLKRSERD